MHDALSAAELLHSEDGSWILGLGLFAFAVVDAQKMRTAVHGHLRPPLLGTKEFIGQVASWLLQLSKLQADDMVFV